MLKWNDDSNLWLLTPSEYAMLPTGFVLTCINGMECTKGVDYIDNDTRFGHLAYGVIDPANHHDSKLLLQIKLTCL
jgi:hypothetical protein